MSVTLLIVDPWQSCVCCTRSGVTLVGLEVSRALDDALPGPYVPVWVTLGALVAYQYTYAPPRFKTSQYRLTIIHLLVSFWNDLADHVFDGV